MGWQVAVKSPRAIGGKKLSLHTLQIVERIVLYATLFPPTYLESLPSKISSYSELTDTNLFLFICLCVCFIFTYLSSRFVQVNVWTQHLRYTGANLYQVSYFKYFSDSYLYYILFFHLPECSGTLNVSCSRFYRRPFKRYGLRLHYRYSMRQCPNPEMLFSSCGKQASCWLWEGRLWPTKFAWLPGN